MKAMGENCYQVTSVKVIPVNSSHHKLTLRGVKLVVANSKSHDEVDAII